MSIRKIVVFVGCLFIALFLNAKGSFAQDNLIYQDNFDNLNNWDYSHKVILEENELISSYGNFGAILKKKVPANLMVECGIKIDAKTSGCPAGIIHLRQNIKDNIWSAYRVEFRPGSCILVLYWRFDLANRKYMKSIKLLELKRWRGKFDTWYNIRVSIVDNQITIWIDGEEMATVTDKNNYAPQGAMGLGSQHTRAHFKNFRILKEE